VIAYIVRRILWGLALLLIVSFLTFVIFYVFPSADPAALRAGRSATPQLIAQIRHQLGLDKPFYEQYWIYVKGIVLHFDLGFSYQNNEPVRTQILSRLPATISLTVGAFVVWIAIGIPVGIVSAVKRRSLLDRMSMGGALVAISAPVYWLGLVALFAFGKAPGGCSGSAARAATCR
jgi:peptide/nickel transport system permease protein